MKRLTFDLSGMGGGYEDMCQLMLWRGVLHLAEAKPPVEMWQRATEYKNLYGIMETEGPDLEALEAAIMRPGEGQSGAMHQCVMGHLRFIHRHGLDEWRRHLATARPEGPYEWDDQGRLGGPAHV